MNPWLAALCPNLEPDLEPDDGAHLLTPDFAVEELLAETETRLIEGALTRALIHDTTAPHGYEECVDE